MHDWHYFFQPNPCNLDQSIYRVFEPEWKAEILCWFACAAVTREQKEALINALINFDDHCGDFFRYRAYFLAAEVVATFKDCSQADTIVSQLLKWSYAYCRTATHDWSIYPLALTRAAREALEKTDRERVANRLAEVVHTTDRLTVLRHAAKRLGQLNPGDASAIAALEQLIQHPQPRYNRFKAVKSLTKIDPHNAIIVPTLIEIARSASKPIEQNVGILRDIVWKFREVAIGNESAIAFLGELVQAWQQETIEQPEDDSVQQTQSESVFLREQIAETLGIIGSGKETAISILIELIRQTKTYPGKFYPTEQHSGWQSVEALGEIAVGHATAISQLAQILSEAQEMPLRCHAAAALLRIDPGNGEAIAVLSEILETTQTELAQLRSLESKPPDCHILIGLAESLLWRSADSLGHNDPANQPAIDALLQLAQTSIAGTPCLPVIQSLRQIDPSNQLAINALVKLMATQPDSFLFDTLWDLHEIGTGNETVIAALVRLIQTSQSDSNREQAASCLGTIDPENALAVTTLIDLLETSKDRNKWWLAQKLGRIGMHNESAVSALVKFAQTFDYSSDWRDREWFTDCFKQLTSNQLLMQVVQQLKNYLHPKPFTNIENKEEIGSQASEDWHDLEGDRQEVCHQITWHCAQNMNYADFYKVWHAF